MIIRRCRDPRGRRRGVRSGNGRPSMILGTEFSNTTMSLMNSGPMGRRLLVVAAGILMGQVVLYGPTLTGSKILLPLDLLAQPDFYLPRTPEVASIVPHDTVLSDLVLHNELARRFSVSELHA